MLTMTDEQRYSEVLKALGDVLMENRATICVQRAEIDELKKKLVKAEYDRDEAIAELKALHKGGAE